MKKTVWMLVALALLLGTACAEGITVTDMMGREITLEEPATRIVALTAADCEILCALGCGDALVGRGEYCDYPPEVLALPSVQSGYETNLEQIVSLAPQVLLMGTMAQTEEQVNRLEEAGVRVVVSDAQNLEGVYTAIRLIGALMGRDAEAEALVGGMQEGFADIAARSRATGRTVYFEVSPLQWGLWTAGSGTFMDELAAICGLENAFADVEGWAAISEEQVLERNPDYIVTITMYDGGELTPVEEIAQRPGWDALSAVQNGRILNADSNEISRPGPRLLQAAETIFRFVNDGAEEAEEPAA